MRYFRFPLIAAAFVMAGSAVAQDYSTIGLHRATYQSKMRYVYEKRATKPDNDARQTAPAAKVQTLSYVVDRARRDATLAQFMDRVRRSDPQAAAIFEAENEKHDVFKVYENIARHYAFEPTDLGDTLAAYKVLNWLIIHNRLEASPTRLKAARDQVGAVAETLTGAENEEFRQRFSEELQIQFVALHSGWRDAMSDGPNSAKARRYAEAVADAWQQRFGEDLRIVRLERTGFTGR